MMRHIKLDMNDYRPRQRGCALTQQEKIARLYALADSLQVKIGTERKQHGRDPLLLSDKS